MMRKVSILTIFTGILSIFFLMFDSVENRIINAAFLLLIGAVLIIFRKRHTFWLLSICFGVYTVLAIWELINLSNAYLISSGSLFAFGTWELLVFKNELKGKTNIRETNQLINHHLQVLFPVIGIAWLISLLLLKIQFKLPFMVILLAGALGIFGFFRFFRMSSKL